MSNSSSRMSRFEGLAGGRGILAAEESGMMGSLSCFDR
jgi:hypothetical protein